MNGNEKLINLATVAMAFGALTLAAVSLARPRSGQPSTQSAQSAIRQSHPVANWQKYALGGNRIGPDSAKVTILEFGDYECPACGGFARTTKAVLPRYSGKVAVVFRDWPLPYHRFAYPAARAANCAAGQGRFAAFHDLLYDKQDSLGLLSFHDLAVRAGITNLTAFDHCANGAGRIAEIDSSSAAAHQIGAWGTPALIVNGTLLAGVPDSAQLEQMITKAILK